MMRLVTFSLALLALSAPVGARAQQLAPVVPAAATSFTSTPSPRAVTESEAPPGPAALDLRILAAVSPRPSYWLQGGIIGALVFAGAAAWFSRICESSDVGGSCGAPRVKFILGAIPLGFITGALIGGNIHPHQAEPPPSQ